MNCPETNKFFFDPPHSGELGGGGAEFQKSGKFHELPRKSINCCLPHPPPLPNRWGVRSQNWRDGWEGGRDVMAIMKLTQCIWHGMGA